MLSHAVLLWNHPVMTCRVVVAHGAGLSCMISAQPGPHLPEMTKSKGMTFVVCVIIIACCVEVGRIGTIEGRLGRHPHISGCPCAGIAISKAWLEIIWSQSLSIHTQWQNGINHHEEHGSGDWHCPSVASFAVGMLHDQCQRGPETLEAIEIVVALATEMSNCSPIVHNSLPNSINEQHITQTAHWSLGISEPLSDDEWLRNLSKMSGLPVCSDWYNRSRVSWACECRSLGMWAAPVGHTGRMETRLTIPEVLEHSLPRKMKKIVFALLTVTTPYLHRGDLTICKQCPGLIPTASKWSSTAWHVWWLRWTFHQHCSVSVRRILTARVAECEYYIWYFWKTSLPNLPYHCHQFETNVKPSNFEFQVNWTLTISNSFLFLLFNVGSIGVQILKWRQGACQICGAPLFHWV